MHRSEGWSGWHAWQAVSFVGFVSGRLQRQGPSRVIITWESAPARWHQCRGRAEAGARWRPSWSAESPNHRVEDRRQDETEEGHAQAATEDGGAQRAARTRRCAGSEVRRHHVDKARRGHHDRPEPHPGGLEYGVEPGRAFLLLVAGKLDNQDGVLARQADQYHEANLGDEVVVHAAGRDARVMAAQHAHRHDQDHRASGSDQLSYRPASTKNTSTAPSTKRA